MPELVKKGSDWVVRPLYPKTSRIDVVAPALDEPTRAEVARQAVLAAFDIFCAGLAHRDFQMRNVFWVDGQLKVVDFETLEAYPPGERPPFPLSYDLTGEGLKSPFLTGNMGYVCKPHPESSLQAVLGVPLERALGELRKELKRELLQASEGFATHRYGQKRHVCRAGRIYSSFDLPFFSVGPDETQRDSAIRLSDFGVGEETFRGKTVLDIGCHTGAMLFSIQKYAPRRCLGLECDADKVRVARRIAAYNGLNNTEFIQADVDALDADVLGGAFDVVLCLSLEAHVKRPKRLYELLAQMAGDVVYLEANTGTDPDQARRSLMGAGFGEVRVLGMCKDDCIADNNTRHLLVARKA
jgi:hypothetical protein